jgi:hypothetical protein
MCRRAKCARSAIVQAVYAVAVLAATELLTSGTYDSVAGHRLRPDERRHHTRALKTGEGQERSCPLSPEGAFRLMEPGHEETDHAAGVVARIAVDARA